MTHGRTIGWWARFYDAAAWIGTFGRISKTRRATIDAAGLQPGERVIDVGCGTGSLALLAGERVRPGGRVVGIDASPQMIQTASKKRKRGKPVEFRVAAIEQLPFEPDEFDAAFSTLMLHHLPDDVKEAGLREVRRVLKPGGRLVIVDLLNSPRGLLGHFAGHRLPENYAEQVMALCRAAGFETVERIASKDENLMFVRAA